MKTYPICATLSLALACFALASEAHAFGRRSTDPGNGSNLSQAIPIRGLELAHVTVPNFYLPNGNRVDMNTDLRALIDTEINQNANFRTVDASARSRLLISGGVTSLELDALQLNLKIGWNPSGALPIPVTPGIRGEVDLRLSNLSLDFKIYDRLTGETYLASYTNETLSNLTFTVRVEISQIGGSLELLTKTKLAEAIRRATRDIMNKFATSPGLHYVPWEAKVLGVADDKSSLVFDAGARQGVKSGTVFSIYSNCEARAGNLCFERFLADVRTTQIGQTSTTALPLGAQDFLSSVYAGDKVYVKILSPRR